jgi:hypothetical protein
MTTDAQTFEVYPLHTLWNESEWKALLSPATISEESGEGSEEQDEGTDKKNLPSFRLTLWGSYQVSTPTTLRRIYVCSFPFYVDKSMSRSSKQEENSDRMKSSFRKEEETTFSSSNGWMYLSVSVEGRIQTLLPDRITGQWVIDKSSQALGTEDPTPVTPLHWAPMDSSTYHHLCCPFYPPKTLSMNVYQDALKKVQPGKRTFMEEHAADDDAGKSDTSFKKKQKRKDVHQANVFPWEWWYVWHQLNYKGPSGRPCAIPQ